MPRKSNGRTRKTKVAPPPQKATTTPRDFEAVITALADITMEYLSHPDAPKEGKRFIHQIRGALWSQFKDEDLLQRFAPHKEIELVGMLMADQEFPRFLDLDVAVDYDDL